MSSSDNVAAVLFVSFVSLAPSVAAAETLYVAPVLASDDDCTTQSNPCATIQDAVDKASDGDKIEIAAGSYAEHVVILRKDLKIVGSGRQLTFLEGLGTNGIAGFDVCGSVVEIRALSIDNHYYGARVRDSCTTNRDISLKMRNIRMECTSAGVIQDGGDLEITKSRFVGGASGVRVTGDSGNVLIAGNVFRNTYAGVFDTSDASVTIRNNDFESSGPGIQLHNYDGTVKVVRNSFLDGETGISVYAGAPTIMNNIIDGAVNGIELTGSESLVAHNTIVNCSQAAIRCYVQSWRDYSWVVNNALLDNDWGFHGETGCRADVQTNAAYQNITANFTGNYDDLGGNLDGLEFQLDGDYAPDSPSSVLLQAGTDDQDLPARDYYRTVRNTPPTIGAVE